MQTCSKLYYLTTISPQYSHSDQEYLHIQSEKNLIFLRGIDLKTFISGDMIKLCTASLELIPTSPKHLSSYQLGNLLTKHLSLERMTSNWYYHPIWILIRLLQQTSINSLLSISWVWVFLENEIHQCFEDKKSIELHAMTFPLHLCIISRKKHRRFLNSDITFVLLVANGTSV